MHVVSALLSKHEHTLSAEEVQRIARQAQQIVERLRQWGGAGGVGWGGVEWSGVGWGGVGWSGVEWGGVEWGGVGWGGVVLSIDVATCLMSGNREASVGLCRSAFLFRLSLCLLPTVVAGGGLL